MLGRKYLDYHTIEHLYFFSTEIDWKEGKNVTKKVIKKKQKRTSGGGVGRFITKTIKADSFFNFFDPPPVKNKDEINEEDDVSLFSIILRLFPLFFHSFDYKCLHPPTKPNPGTISVWGGGGTACIVLIDGGVYTLAAREESATLHCPVRR